MSLMQPSLVMSYHVLLTTNHMFINPDYNSKVMVFDFGGGTCDISVLEIGKNANGFSPRTSLSRSSQSLVEMMLIVTLHFTI